MNKEKKVSNQTSTYMKYDVGIDVGKNELKVCLSAMRFDFGIDIQSQEVYPNDKKGWKSLTGWILKQSKQSSSNVHCTMEATGVYHEGVAHYLHENKYIVHVVLANQSRSYGQSFGIKSKTDKIDAQTLSRMGLERTLREWNPPSSTFVTLKQLTRERERLVKLKTSLKNNLHSYEYQAIPHKSTVKRTTETVSFINGQIKAIDKEIALEMDKDETIKRKLPYLLSIKGTGILTAAIIIAETQGFANMDSRKQVASYCGLDVRVSESGTWKGQSRISKKGNAHIRHALYMPTLTKIRFDASTKEHYEQLAKRIGNMKAVTAESRIFVCLMFTLWKKEEMYCPNKDASVNVNPEPVNIPSVNVEEHKNENILAAKTVVENAAMCTENAGTPASNEMTLAPEEQKNENRDVAETVAKKTAVCTENAGIPVSNDKTLVSIKRKKMK
jgi:transposase